MATATKRKIHERTYEEKMRIIQYREAHPSLKHKDVAAHFGVSTSTLTGILKAKDKITTACGANADARAESLKRIRTVTHLDVDQALLVWFRQKAVQPDIRLDGSMLLIKANQFRLEFDPDDTNAINMAWIDRFKHRHGIARIQKAGESAGVDVEIVRVWKEGKLQDVISRYEAKDVFNADETGLFWRLLPDNSLGFKGTVYHGSKQPKTRITVLVAANMDGSEKLPLFVIGKSAKPRAFKNLSKVPVDYTSNKKAWMTGAIFEDWCRKLDRRMRLEGRKIALLVDNCPAHPTLELQNIELVFLPPNTTSVTQPMDAGVIRSLKYHYRYILASKRLQASDSESTFEWNILDAIIGIKSAWKSVTQQTIQNCYRKAGFEKNPNNQAPADDDSMEDETPLRNIWDALRAQYGDAMGDVESYLSIDDNAPVSAEMTDAEIVEMVKNPDSMGDEKADDDDDADDTENITLQDAYKCLRTLRMYGLRNAMELEELTDKIERILMIGSQKRLVQKKITDF